MVAALWPEGTNSSLFQDYNSIKDANIPSQPLFSLLHNSCSPLAIPISAAYTLRLKRASSHSECVGCAWRFREWSRSSQRIQNLDIAARKCIQRSCNSMEPYHPNVSPRHKNTSLIAAHKCIQCSQPSMCAPTAARKRIQWSGDSMRQPPIVSIDNVA